MVLLQKLSECPWFIQFDAIVIFLVLGQKKSMYSYAERSLDLHSTKSYLYR